MSTSTKRKPAAELNLTALGRRIRELRGFDTSQADFARQIGITQSHLSALERGTREPGAAVLLAIKREFGKSVDWLLTGEEPVRTRKQK
jgi:transcriptional regulator with XRE-family HTH domain